MARVESISSGVGVFVKKTGDTMSGPLVIDGTGTILDVRGSVAINSLKDATGSLNISGKDDTNLVYVDYANNAVLFNTASFDGVSKYHFANGTTRFDENFLFRKGSGEQVVARQMPGGGGGSGYDLKFEAGNRDMLMLRGSGALEFGNASMTGIVFNENGNDYDIRMEGDTDQNLFYLDAGNDRVGLGTSSPTAKLDVNGDTIRLRSSKTPSSASDTGNAGDIAWDADYVYVCVATNTWKRSAITTW